MLKPLRYAKRSQGQLASASDQGRDSVGRAGGPDQAPSATSGATPIPNATAPWNGPAGAMSFAPIVTSTKPPSNVGDVIDLMVSGPITRKGTCGFSVGSTVIHDVDATHSVEPDELRPTTRRLDVRREARDGTADSMHEDRPLRTARPGNQRQDGVARRAMGNGSGHPSCLTVAGASGARYLSRPAPQLYLAQRALSRG